MVLHIRDQLKYIECYLDRRAIVSEMQTSGVTDELYKKFLRLEHISLDISEKLGKISKLKKILEELKLLSKDVKESCRGLVNLGAWRDVVLDPLTSYSKIGAEDDLFSEKVQNGQLSKGEIVLWNAEVQRVSEKLVDSQLSEERRAKWRTLLRALEEGAKEVHEEKRSGQGGEN